MLYIKVSEALLFIFIFITASEQLKQADRYGANGVLELQVGSGSGLIAVILFGLGPVTDKMSQVLSQCVPSAAELHQSRPQWIQSSSSTNI